MATVYILYSKSQDNFYIGSCKDLELRLLQHQQKAFDNSFTANADDWTLFYSIPDLHYQQARKIENHIKKMKSRRHLENLKKYPEISNRLISKYYGAGSSR